MIVFKNDFGKGKIPNKAILAGCEKGSGKFELKFSFCEPYRYKSNKRILIYK